MRFLVEVHHRRSQRAKKAGESTGAVCCVVGQSRTLGQWDPKRSPKLQKVVAEELQKIDSTLWTGEVDDALLSPNEEYKFCILNLSRSEYVWEESGPMHRMPSSGSCIKAHFEDGGSDTSEITSTNSSKDSTQAPIETGLICLRLIITNTQSSRAASVALREGAECCVVGEIAALGKWDPKNAPKLSKKLIENGQVTFEGHLESQKLKPGQEYKYCILHRDSNTYIWEESIPPHVLPSPGADETIFFENRRAGLEPGNVGYSPQAGGNPKVLQPLVVELGDSFVHTWIPWCCDICCDPKVVKGVVSAPATIFHAFHWPFSKVKEKLEYLKDLGFTAVQLSPAQKSKSGHEWWTRYQPLDYLQIFGLGSIEELRGLCTRAAELKMMIIADVVFNHMIVVASCSEWTRAQQSAQKLNVLKERLAGVVGPTFDVADFQWPWFNMSGEHWDNENRYEGWGNGEWSELRYCPKVIEIQQKHLQILLDAGVRGFRFDAVKHMRPEHVGDHIRYLRQASVGVFAYGEVLSVDEQMHQEYMSPLAMPSTDFALTVYINAVLTGDVGVAEGGVRAVASKAARSEGVSVEHAKMQKTSSPTLSADSIRFARNHDTVMNPGSFYGLSGSCQSSILSWVWLLAVHDGSVLIYPDDLFDRQTGPLLQRALVFRGRMQEHASTSDVCLCFAKGGSPLQLLIVALRTLGGELRGLCLANPSKRNSLFVTSIPALARASSSQDLRHEDGTIINLLSDGTLEDPMGVSQGLTIPPTDAVFLTINLT